MIIIAQDKADVAADHVHSVLDMIADIYLGDNKRKQSSIFLLGRYCECVDTKEDTRLVVQACMWIISAMIFEEKYPWLGSA